MARTEVATGDSIAEQVKGRTGDSNFADIARALSSDHDSRPGLFKQDLAKVNDALHAQGILPGFDLVGVNGQDLTAKGPDGKITTFDSTNLHNNQAGADSTPGQMNGRQTTQNGDGSGTVTVAKGDNPWKLGSDILKSQGINDPSDRQIANLYKELKQMNPSKTLDHMQPGDTLNYPASVMAGDHTDFIGKRNANDAVKSKLEIAENCDAAKQVIGKFGDGGNIFTGGSYITQDQITKALQRTDITDQDRKGLNYIQGLYASNANNGSFHLNDIDGLQTKFQGLVDAGLSQENDMDNKNN